jgi:hypothetical protein
MQWALLHSRWSLEDMKSLWRKRYITFLQNKKHADIEGSQATWLIFLINNFRIVGAASRGIVPLVPQHHFSRSFTVAQPREGIVPSLSMGYRSSVWQVKDWWVTFFFFVDIWYLLINFLFLSSTEEEIFWDEVSLVRELKIKVRMTLKCSSWYVQRFFFNMYPLANLLESQIQALDVLCFSQSEYVNKVKSRFRSKPKWVHHKRA